MGITETMALDPAKICKRLYGWSCRGCGKIGCDGNGRSTEPPMHVDQPPASKPNETEKRVIARCEKRNKLRNPGMHEAVRVTAVSWHEGIPVYVIVCDDIKKTRVPVAMVGDEMSKHAPPGARECIAAYIAQRDA